LVFRGNARIKTATVKIGDRDVRIAVCNGISEARDLIETEHYKEYDFIEVMSCMGGCISGGGQPFLPRRSLASKRSEGLYSVDEKKVVHDCSENPEIQAVYKEFFGRPCHDNAHKYLHTHFDRRAVLRGKVPKNKQITVGFDAPLRQSARMVAGIVRARPLELGTLRAEFIT
jgi:iron only hydrogenase large subunit-like protein